MPPFSDALFVDTAEMLAEVAASVAAASRVGIDTEFHAERRYRPELLLVQLALPTGQVWLVDPRAVDLHPLAAALSSVEWVLHGGETDIYLLHREAGARPTCLLDTQILAAMAGWDHPVPLSDLARDLLGQAMDKSVGMTDWTTRPLSASQRRYAAEDAVIVLEVAQALEARGIEASRLEWAHAAGQELVEVALTPPDPQASWLRLGLASRLDEDTRRVLVALYAWRERLARDRDVPPSYTLSDAVALDLARRRPTSASQMAENRRTPSGLVKRYGADLVDEIRRAMDGSGPVPAGPPPEERRLAQGLRCWAQAMEPVTGIAPSLALPPGLTTGLAREGIAALNGWRSMAFGDALSAFLAGETTLCIRDGRLAAVPR